MSYQFEGGPRVVGKDLSSKYFIWIVIFRPFFVMLSFAIKLQKFNLVNCLEQLKL